MSCCNVKGLQCVDFFQGTFCTRKYDQDDILKYKTAEDDNSPFCCGVMWCAPLYCAYCQVARYVREQDSGREVLL